MSVLCVRLRALVLLSISECMLHKRQHNMLRTVCLGRLRVALGWYGMSFLDAAAPLPVPPLAPRVMMLFSITDFVLHLCALRIRSVHLSAAMHHLVFARCWCCSSI